MIRAALAGLALALAGPGAAQQAGPDQVRPDPANADRAEPGQGAPAADPVRLRRIEEAWRFWLAQHDVPRATLAISYRGEVVHAAGAGRAAAAPVELASVGKSITALCLDALVRAGLAGYDTRLGEVLGDLPGAGGALADVTLWQVVSQSAGLGPDGTQAPMWDWLGDDTARHAQVTAAALGRGEQAAAPGGYAYNNENYAVLGTVIERLAGLPYREACAARVLADFPSAAPSPRTGGFDAWGGWVMSVADYAAFHGRHFGPGSPIAADPEAFPHALVGGGTHYGMGMFFREYQGAHNFWHSGSLCFGRFRRGSFAVSWKGEWGVVAAHDACIGFDALVALDNALAIAALRP
ncbi:MAG: beta-lactamase family protein [Rhodobacteraceae bacterium]|nr:beta-lactamase family protein [Paracoccaceae bacterium]